MNKKIKVLDRGYISLTGTMLSESEDKECAQTLDQMVVEAARVSFGDGLKGTEKDKKLLHYLQEHEHGTPFESAVFKFEVKCPIYVQRQWRTHRWGSFNEISGRYTEELATEYYLPKELRGQDNQNKQGSLPNVSLDTISVTEGESFDFFAPGFRGMILTAIEFYEQVLIHQQNQYNRLLKAGVSRELARGVLGTAFYTKFVWVVNARSIMNFLILRTEGHAQWEIREYAKALLEILKEKMPWTFESLTKSFPSIFGEQQ